MILIFAEIESRHHSTQQNKFRSWFNFEFENQFQPGVHIHPCWRKTFWEKEFRVGLYGVLDLKTNTSIQGLYIM